MADTSQLKFLVRLLDDESPTVETAVAEALMGFGDRLWAGLDDLAVPLTAEQVQRIEALTGERRSQSTENEASVVGELGYGPGRLVRHCGLGYRGVIVAVAAATPPSEQRTSARRTRPSPNQPWYHILVDGSTQVVRVAEEDLEADPSGQPVNHPLLERFFDEFSGDVYRRNDVPWN